MSFLEVRHVQKIYTTRFGGTKVQALSDVNFTVEKGEYVAIMGESGSGKTTLLNILAALDKPTGGEVVLDDRALGTIPEREIAAFRRSQLGFVFQEFNLLDTFSVQDNIFLPLVLAGKAYPEMAARLAPIARQLGIAELLQKFPYELSGGQKQRVAIARALANNPRVLLLDEPLGALDLQLRRTMQLELKRLQKKLGITFIYITHDQEEAINMSDRIVVMNQGQFEQIGTPDEIYNHPKTSYVATFVGNANILKGKVVEINGSYAQVQIGNDTVSVYTEEIVKVGEQLTLAVRSENILLDEAEMENVVEQNEAEGTGRHLHATVKEKNFAAGQLRVLLALSDGTELTASRFGMNANIQPGQQIKWYFDPRNAIVVDREFKTKEPADMSGGNQ